jgi:hypothetical protein
MVVRLLRGTFGVFASDLGAVEVVYFYPRFFCEIVGFFDRIPHGDGDKVLLAAVRQLVVANDFSSPFLIKMVALHSMLIMGLGVKSCSIFNV